MSAAADSPQGTTSLGNWREHPQNRWSFQNVAQLINCDHIAADPTDSLSLEEKSVDIGGLSFPAPGDQNWSLSDLLVSTFTDALLVLHGGAIGFEWRAGHYDPNKPHIVFSVSKSITATLSGILEGKGLLDRGQPVSRYLPEVRGCAYSQCTVQQVLDMTVALDFEEAYNDQAGQFARYRAATAWNPPLPGSDPQNLKGFLCGLKALNQEHGEVFRYMSPNSDLLGWIIERAGGDRLSVLMSDYLWRPMGAADTALITVDREGTARTAGGICATLHDLGRFGELIRGGGRRGENQVVPDWWISDTLTKGSNAAWERGSFRDFVPGGRYRNQWYQSAGSGGPYFAVGIHGQWIYIDPRSATTIVKISSQPAPVSEPLDGVLLNAFDMICTSMPG